MKVVNNHAYIVAEAEGHGLQVSYSQAHIGAVGCLQTNTVFSPSYVISHGCLLRLIAVKCNAFLPFKVQLYVAGIFRGNHAQMNGLHVFK